MEKFYKIGFFIEFAVIVIFIGIAVWFFRVSTTSSQDLAELAKTGKYSGPIVGDIVSTQTIREGKIVSIVNDSLVLEPKRLRIEGGDTGQVNVNFDQNTQFILLRYKNADNYTEELQRYQTEGGGAAPEAYTREAVDKSYFQPGMDIIVRTNTPVADKQDIKAMEIQVNLQE